MLAVSNDFGFDLPTTERDVFDIDHCAAGAWLPKEWDFPDELAQAIAAHHDEPTPGTTGLNSLVQISWRLADALGFATFPGHESGYEELIAHLPASSAASWLGRDPDEAGEALAMRLMNM